MLFIVVSLVSLTGAKLHAEQKIYYQSNKNHDELDEGVAQSLSVSPSENGRLRALQNKL